MNHQLTHTSIPDPSPAHRGSAPADAGAPGVARARHGPGAPSLFTPMSFRSDFTAAYPELERVCREIGFGPGLSLGRWCTSPDWALLELARSASPPQPSAACDWSQAEIDELITCLVEHHHRPLRHELRRLGILARNLAHCYVNARLSTLDQAFVQLETALCAHLDNEEDEVFPRCLAIETANRGHQDGTGSRIDVTTAIRMMASGHAQSMQDCAAVQAALDAAMGEIANSDLVLVHRGMNALVADFAVHTALEDGILVPAALFAEEQYDASRQDPDAASPGPRLAYAQD
jgi:iron-sulfur cluster repair protein YtfE (RIC family)